MELTKIAQDEELTYLEKVAAIVDEFAAGNVDGENADAIATEAGISPEDLLSVYNAAYGEADIEKTAAEIEEEDADLAKEAADEAVSMLIKIAEDVDSTYLEKCASLADTFAAGAISGEDADTIAVELGLEPSDVASIFDVAYGDELEKEAKTKASGVVDAIKDITGYNNIKSGASKFGLGRQKQKAGKEALDRAKDYGNKGNHKYNKTKLEGAKLRGEGSKELATGAAKGAAIGGAGYGATQMFSGKKED